MCRPYIDTNNTQGMQLQGDQPVNREKPFVTIVNRVF